MNQEITPFKNRDINYTKPVKVYRNLNGKTEKEKYSIQQKGLVVGHTNTLVMYSVSFIIGKGGKKRAIQTGQRNVHAFLKGYLYNIENYEIDLSKFGYYRVCYDTFKNEGFIYQTNGKEIKKSESIFLLENGLFAFKPTFYEKPEKYI